LVTPVALTAGLCPLKLLFPIPAATSIKLPADLSAIISSVFLEESAVFYAIVNKEVHTNSIAKVILNM